MLKFNNQNVFLSSDFHLQHKNICKGSSNWPDPENCRDFANPDEMWEVIRNNINAVVKSNDVFLNLGDIIFGDKSNLTQYMNELNCDNHMLIYGNHDKWLHKPDNRNYKDLFSLGCFHGQDILVDGRRIVLQHFAQLSWDEQHRGTIMCHGHSHNNMRYPKELLNSKIIDVGVDSDIDGHEPMTPYSHKELFAIMDKRTQLAGLDHHNEKTT